MNLRSILRNTRNYISRAAGITTLALASFLISGCPSPILPPSAIPESPEDESPKAELSERTHILNQEELSNIYSIGEDNIVFIGSTSYSPGDIIAAGDSSQTPGGLLRKVLSGPVSSARAISGTHAVYTEDASLDEAIKNGAFESELEFGRIEFDKYFKDVVLLDLDGDGSTHNDQVKATGNLSLDSNFQISFDISNFHLDKFALVNNIHEETNFQITTPFSHNSNFYRERVFFDHNLPSIPLGTIAGLPIWGTPNIEAYAGASGEILPIFSATQRADLTTGLSYNDGDWNIIKEISGFWDCFPRTLEDSVDFKVFVGTRLNILINRVGGPYGELNGYVRFVDEVGSPWELRTGLEANLGAKMKVFSRTIADTGKLNIFDKYTVVAQGDPDEEPATETFTDPRDSQVYDIIKVGDDWWMAENLNYNVLSGDYMTSYGRLYDYSSRDDACPPGWHIPTRSEWGELFDTIGGKLVAGGKLKEEGTTHWTYPNTGATNEIGFTALPAGRFEDGNFADEGYGAFFWADTSPYAFAYWLQYDVRTISETASNNPDDLYYSIRCVKD